MRRQNSVGGLAVALTLPYQRRRDALSSSPFFLLNSQEAPTTRGEHLGAAVNHHESAVDHAPAARVCHGPRHALARLGGHHRLMHPGTVYDGQYLH